MIRTILSLLSCICCLAAFSYDFSYKGVNYTVTDSVARTCKTDRTRYEDYKDYLPELTIYDTVYDGTEAYTVTEIGDESFYSTGVRSFKLPSSIKSIGKGAFRYCDSFDSITLPDGLMSIGDEAFMCCNNLKSIELPDGLKSIGDRAFFDCTGLRSFRVPSSVSHLGDAFVLLGGRLHEIELDRHNPYYVDVDGLIYDRDMTILVARSRPWEEALYVAPSTLKEIGDYAFGNYSGYIFPDNMHLEKVVLPDGLIRIGKCAFYKCNSLSEVNFPTTLKTLGASAFAYCALREAVIPEGVDSIDMIFNCDPLETVRIYGEFDWVQIPFSGDNIKSIYYITDNPQASNGKYEEYESGDGGHHFTRYIYSAGRIFWEIVFAKDLDHPYDPAKDNPFYLRHQYVDATLYVTEAAYEKIVNGKLLPWSYFNNIEVYDPTDDPYVSAEVDTVIGDYDSDAPMSVYTIGGVMISDSTDGLAPGLYIVRRGSKAEKIIVR